eukprot:TRINITY_DN26825_c0_g1_i1.p1 TRINITY_DN26825_c0_g1~~TRINITY_DN26825_c0_g1_i1.p1  ORF type:complete len:237 (-),score=59.62 TRINITY_DN26825_c0_g1_i1:93-803(-)
MENVLSHLDDEKARKNTICVLARSRCKQIKYIKKLLTDKKNHWFNIGLIQRVDFFIRFHPEGGLQKRARLWFRLGVSLAPLMQIEDTATLIRSLSQTMEELDHFTVTEDSRMFRPFGFAYKKSVSVNMDDRDSPVKPRLQRMGSHVIYEFLNSVNIPCELDFFEVVYALCDILTMMYPRFDDEIARSKHFFDAVTKIDARLRADFLGVLEKEMVLFTQEKVDEQTADLDKLFKAWG